jgi:hypothetical protein
VIAHIEQIGMSVTDFDLTGNMVTFKQSGDWMKLDVAFDKNGVPMSYSDCGGVDPWTGSAWTDHHPRADATARGWLSKVKSHADLSEAFRRELDPFEALAKSHSAIESATNETFQPEEQAQILARLGTLELHVKEQAATLTEAQTQILTREIRYLGEASQRMGRKDWLNVLFSVVISFVTNGVYAPDRAHELVNYVGSLFAFLSSGPLLGS